MQENTSENNVSDYASVALSIKTWGKELGFQDIRIADAHADMTAIESGLFKWLGEGYHGDMDYMAKHGTKRTRPAELEPGTQRVISVCMNYAPPSIKNSWEVIHSGDRAFISRYALGRDYHKVIRARLQKLADRMTAQIGTFQYRVFSDSAPVMEVAWAQKAGLGWRGKHTLLLNRQAGSMFFLGEMYVNLPLPVDEETGNYCGSCTRCIDICPTQAITAPYRLDARRCISYLTIEMKDSIPEPLRPLIGNRVYGCDDCQLICPWNKYAKITREADFHVRNGLDDVSLIELFGWDQATFEAKLAGSAIRRIGYQQWLRNIAVGLGNAPYSTEIVQALQGRADDASELVREHVQWALQQQDQKRTANQE
ncbi:tRNA epoxyqueuosine(34) reductase QueG [Nitrosomonas sp. JL21]|uniref:tRNA epoxyqueuosine(34) reductase QueG n=1 Tax=Nitrosomonas sp. JL21 TaxID=153949 RepID=UPI00136A1369|nr:tRNA epoxyqueuosine(34) reductase QueG [Nitrosomonas sp. JL21]MBL8498933.1 tRNA epoxyqueuosine(34) reductase QueG [Nitrosomonas sp.]MCC7092473.1 tRNA epoxyqueuosine(34) reductase QueG [Nitrosomonas sp.]MXS76717.1 tRNA epoxyqueuosine(34) reductase QueG [Nitrosomonas sp. JL21]